jgi:hypothetical protein
MARLVWVSVVFLSIVVAIGLVRIPGTGLPETGGPEIPGLPKAHAWERAQWHVQKRLGEGMEHIPMNALEPARTTMEAMARSDPSARYAARHPEQLLAKSASAWQPLGPNQKGGRTRRIVLDSQGTMYASGVSGGVWRYNGFGWGPLGDRLVNVNVGALAISPANDEVIFAGTGELYRRTNRPYSSMTGSGIFKSTNAGEDWVQLQSSVSEDFSYVSDIVISPNNAARIYAATNTGVWRSDDNGASFVQTLSTDEGNGNLFEGCTDLTVRNDMGVDWVLATCSSRSEDDRYFLPGLLPGSCNGPCDGRIYLNQDAAASDDWQVVLTEAGMGRTSLSVFPGNQDVVYALSSSTLPGPDKTGDGRGDYDNGLHAVFRSDDGGQTWNATVRNTDDDPVSTWMLSFAWQARTDGQTPYGAGWYNQAIAVDPSNPDVVWVGGMQLYRSDDGGQTFGLTSNYFADTDVLGAQGPQMHPDVHVLTFDQTGRLWIGNDGGVWRANNQSAPTDRVNDGYRSMLVGGVTFTSRVSGYTTTQFYHGTVSPDGNLVIGGMQDNGTDALNLPGLPGWVTVYGGDGAYSAYDPIGPFYYFSAQGATLSRFDENFNSTYLGNALQAAALDNDEFMFILPYVIDPSDNSRLYTGGKRLFRGDQFGDTWTRASARFGFSFQDKTNAIAVAPTRSDWVLLGTGNAIYKSSQASTANQTDQLPSTSPRSGWVSSLIFDPGDESVAYATYSAFGGDHVWKSTDGGLSFFPIDGQGEGRLPDVPVHSLAVDPVNTDHLYVGTDLGVFFSEDGGLNWQVEETGFGGAIVERVVINQPQEAGTSYLFAFTYGRGVWRVPLAEVDGQPDYQVSPDVNGFWYVSSEPGHGIQVQLLDIGGELQMLVAWYVYYQGEPMWLIGVGDVDRDRARIPMTVTRGTGFGDDFDSESVIREDWGSLELVFESDTELSLRWQSDHGDGEVGTLSMDHLSKPESISVPNTDVGLCSSGVYWNPTQDGQGLLVESVMLDGQPGLSWSWYHYRDGEQLWLVGSGVFEGNRVVAEAYAGVTGEFPPAFKSNESQVDLWGTVEFVFDGERNFTLNWNPQGQPEQPGSLDYSQLAGLADSGCL